MNKQQKQQHNDNWRLVSANQELSIDEGITSPTREPDNLPKKSKLSFLFIVLGVILALFLVSWLVVNLDYISGPKTTNLHQNDPSKQPIQGHEPKKGEHKEEFLPKEPAQGNTNQNKPGSPPSKGDPNSSPKTPSKPNNPPNQEQPPQKQPPQGPIDSHKPPGGSTSPTKPVDTTTTTPGQSGPSSKDISLSEQEALCKAQNYQHHTPGAARRKIYDLFMVRDELDLLEIRLGQMWNEVDYFVILESPTAFTGKPKNLTLLENWDMFKPYHSKMIRHTLNTTGQNFRNTWEHERFQRDAMYDQVVPHLTGERKIEQGDVILVSDADELIRDSVLQTLRYCDFPRKLTLGSQFFYYSYEFLHMGEEWLHPQATYYDGARTARPQELRDEQNNGGRIMYHNAGWHCSYCFSKIDDIVEKLHSFSHQEYNNEEYTNRAKILHRVIHGIDLFNRGWERFQRIENNEDIPQYVKDNKDKFKYMVERPAPHGNFVDFKPEDAALN